MLLQCTAQKPLIQLVTTWRMQVLELNSESESDVKVVFVLRNRKFVLHVDNSSWSGIWNSVLLNKVQKLCEFLARLSMTFELEEIW